jgi:hypothetical protein
MLGPTVGMGRLTHVPCNLSLILFIGKKSYGKCYPGTSRVISGSYTGDRSLFYYIIIIYLLKVDEVSWFVDLFAKKLKNKYLR